MATISYTPSTIAGTFATLADIRSVYATNGVRTGFGFYTNGTTPAYFTTNNALMNALADEGFFTGSNPKVFYTPEQAATLLSKAFVLDGTPMYGIEYKLRTEGFTVGDFMQGMVQHSPGDSTAIIIGNLQTEGYVTGLQGILSPADAALFDSQCIDGRCIGSGCVAPTMYHLGQLTAGSTVGVGTIDSSDVGGDYQVAVSDAFTINVPFNARLMLFLSAKWGRTGSGDIGDNDLGCLVRVSLDGSTLPAPYIFNQSATSGTTPDQSNPVGVQDISGGADHTVSVSAKAKKASNINYWLVDLWAFVFKAAC